MATASNDLLQASLTGTIPPDVEQAFKVEREKGNLAYRNGNYIAAIEHYSKAEVINPLSPLPPANRAMVYIKMKNWPKAREEAAVALELHNALPVHLQSQSLTVKLLLRRATACKNIMLFALAVEDYESVLEMDPSNTIAKEELEELRSRYHIAPQRSVKPTASRKSGGAVHGEHRDLIRVVSESNGSGPSISSNIAQFRSQIKPSGHNDVMQEDTQMFSLPADAAQELAGRESATPPDSGSQFEHVWRTLSNDMHAQARYLTQIVGAKRVRDGLIGDGLTPQMLERIAVVLMTALRYEIASADEVANMLLAFAHAPRFEMLKMFLSTDDRRPFIDLINQLSVCGVNQTSILQLRALYS